jgi:hypothetical protein
LSPFNHLRRAEKDFEILPKCERADFVTDTCEAEFIKSAEMSRRGMSDLYLKKGNKTNLKVLQECKCVFVIKIKEQLKLEELSEDKYAGKLEGRRILCL